MAIPQKTLDDLLRELRLIQEHRQAGVEKKIARAYKRCRAELRGWLGNFFTDHAQPDGSLTYADVQAAGGKARFLEELQRHTEYVSDLVQQEIDTLVHDTYAACYDGMVKAVKSASDAAQLRSAFDGLVGCTPHQIKAAVENPIHGIKLPERLERTRKATLDTIRRDVAVGLQNGDRYTSMARRISDDLEMDYRKSVRIARTEAHRVREQGFNDSSNDIQDKLVGSGFVMAKTWRTMQDERVRPQMTKKGKPKGTANHRVMQDVTVLQDEDFDLGNGVTASCPGSSGDAGNDINCRCLVSRKLMKVEEYEQLTGKSVPEKYRRRDLSEYSPSEENTHEGPESPYIERIDYSDASNFAGDDIELQNMLRSDNIQQISSAVDTILERDYDFPKSEWRRSTFQVPDGSLGIGKVGVASFSDNCIRICESYTNDIKTHIHEHLHLRSANTYPNARAVYLQHSKIEEGTVEFLAQEICKSRNVRFGPSYSEFVDPLRNIRHIIRPMQSDLDFAKELLDIPLHKRYNYIERLVRTYVDTGGRRPAVLTRLDKALDSIRGGGGMT